MSDSELQITLSLMAIKDIIEARIKANEAFTEAILDEISRRMNSAKYLYSIMH